MEICKLLPYLKLHGRTRLDGDCLYMNWTCSGFSIAFTGKKVEARLRALSEKAMEGAEEYPWAGVTLDGGEILTNRFECRGADVWYTLWEASEEEQHSIRFIKLTENSRGKLGVLELRTDGFFLHPQQEKHRTIEFIGDSITCGFGNEATERDALFAPAEENGWITYAAIASRLLNAEFNCISVSGISANAPQKPMFPMKPMQELYAYTDRLYDDRMEQAPELWDFAGNRKDLVVINLGTNDVNPVRFYKDLAQADLEEQHFIAKYKAFIRDIRKLNGPQTEIVCALGPMDFYLYDDIRIAVEQYQKESGDERVWSLKIIGTNLMTEGFGAVGHPSAKTHERAGRELAARLQKIMGWDDK